MTVAIDVTSMDVDHDSSSPAKSDSGKSEVTQPSSIDECDFPKSSTRKELTRISPFTKFLEQEHDGVFELQEAVATTLFSAAPDILTSFGDPMVGTFKAIFKGEKQLVIWRKGNAGFVSVHCTPHFISD